MSVQEDVESASFAALQAEAEFAAGRIGLDVLCARYRKLVPPGVYDNFGEWSKLVSRASRLSRLSGRVGEYVLY